jgi:hypothetical protein
MPFRRQTLRLTRSAAALLNDWSSPGAPGPPALRLPPYGNHKPPVPPHQLPRLSDQATAPSVAARLRPLFIGGGGGEGRRRSPHPGHLSGGGGEAPSRLPAPAASRGALPAPRRRSPPLAAAAAA